MKTTSGRNSLAYVHWLEDGDHDFKPRKASGRTQIELWEEACSTIDDFAAKLAG